MVQTGWGGGLLVNDRQAIGRNPYVEPLIAHGAVMARQAVPITIAFGSRSDLDVVRTDLTEKSEEFAPAGVKLWIKPPSAIYADADILMTILIGVASGVSSDLLVQLMKTLFRYLRRQYDDKSTSVSPGITSSVVVKVGSINLTINQDTTETVIQRSAEALASELSKQLT